MQPDNIGKRLKHLRVMRGLTNRVLAVLAGVPQSTISQVAAGHRQGGGLQLDTAKRLSWALGVGLEALAVPYDEEYLPVQHAPASPPPPTKRQRTRTAATRA